MEGRAARAQALRSTPLSGTPTWPSSPGWPPGPASPAPPASPTWPRPARCCTGGPSASAASPACSTSPSSPGCSGPEAGDAPAALAMGLAGLLAAYDLDEAAPAGPDRPVPAAGRPRPPGRPRRPPRPGWPPPWWTDSWRPAPTASILDPACGAGAFLCRAIRRKRAALGDSPRPWPTSRSPWPASTRTRWR